MKAGHFDFLRFAVFITLRNNITKCKFAKVYSKDLVFPNIMLDKFILLNMDILLLTFTESSILNRSPHQWRVYNVSSKRDVIVVNIAFVVS